MVKDYTFQEAEQQKNLRWIDVRSPGEFAQATIPGAVNLPLFDDEERAEIGTIYKQISVEAARKAGVHIVSAKLPYLMEQMAQIIGREKGIVFCWRGGMRSKTMATMAGLLDMPVFRLTGGYRSYRQHVTAFLQGISQEAIPPLFVLHGMTGVGKTQLLAKLRALGEPVIDLEDLARHRGSVFGAIDRNPANQRQFESGLYAYFQPQNQAPYYIIEAESKRIGHATMPDFLDEAKHRGYAIEVTAPFEQRIERTLAAYQSEDRDAFYEAVDHALTRIERRLSPDSRKGLQAAFTARDDAKLAAILLADYYDPMYRYGMAQYETVFEKVDATDLDEAVLTIVSILKRIMGTIP